MAPCLLPLLQFLLVASTALAQNWTADPFIPPAIPFAVKSPYLQTWSRQGTPQSTGPLYGLWPTWTGLIRVDDDDRCHWMGPGGGTVQKGMTVRIPL